MNTGDVAIMDTQFHPRIYSSTAPHTFQEGNVAVTTCISHRTSKVIGINTSSKHCAKRQALKRKNLEAECPKHEGRCTADLQPQDSIGDESRYVKIIC